jgi:hypothetical protein
VVQFIENSITANKRSGITKSPSVRSFTICFTICIDPEIRISPRDLKICLKICNDPEIRIDAGNQTIERRQIDSAAIERSVGKSGTVTNVGKSGTVTNVGKSGAVANVGKPNKKIERSDSSTSLGGSGGARTSVFRDVHVAKKQILQQTAPLNKKSLSLNDLDSPPVHFNQLRVNGKTTAYLKSPTSLYKRIQGPVAFTTMIVIGVSSLVGVCYAIWSDQQGNNGTTIIDKSVHHHYHNTTYMYTKPAVDEYNNPIMLHNKPVLQPITPEEAMRETGVEREDIRVMGKIMNVLRTRDRNLTFTEVYTKTEIGNRYQDIVKDNVNLMLFDHTTYNEEDFVNMDPDEYNKWLEKSAEQIMDVYYKCKAKAKEIIGLVVKDFQKKMLSIQR